MPTPANLVHQVTTSTGSGTLTLVKVNGKNDFATAFTTGGANVFDYFISNRDAAEWERGTGSCPTTNTLQRDTVIETHAGSTVAISFTAGTMDITNDVPALDQVRATTAPSSGFIPSYVTTAGNLLQPSGVKATTAAFFPATADGVTLGTTANEFSDLFLASGGVVNWSSGNATITHSANNLSVQASTVTVGGLKVSTASVVPATASGLTLGTAALPFGDGAIGGILISTASVRPATNDGVSLGTSALKFSDLHLASGGVLQFSTEGTNITHAASQLTIAASSLNINTSQLTITAVTADIGSVRFTTSAVFPATNDGVTLGTSANKWADLYLASGSVVDFSTGDITVTHSANTLTIAGGALELGTIGATTTSAVRAGGAQTLTGKTIAFADNTLTGVQASLTSGPGIAFSGTTISVVLTSGNGITVSGSTVSAEAATTNVEGIMEVAEDDEYRANTAGSLALTPAKVWSAAGSVALSAATSAVAVDMSTFLTVATLAMATNHTLSDPTSPKVGQHFIVSVATTTLRTLSLSTAWKLWSNVEAGPYTVTTLEKLYLAGFIESSTGCRVTAVARTTVIA
jgi:hypothetical protein